MKAQFAEIRAVYRDVRRLLTT